MEDPLWVLEMAGASVRVTPIAEAARGRMAALMSTWTTGFHEGIEETYARAAAKFPTESGYTVEEPGPREVALDGIVTKGMGFDAKRGSGERSVRFETFALEGPGVACTISVFDAECTQASTAAWDAVLSSFEVTSDPSRSIASLARRPSF